MRARRALSAIVLLALFAGIAEPADYYLGATGDDRAPGTSADQPWRTLGRVNRQGPGPGDRVFLRGGDTFHGSLVILGSPGRVGGPALLVASFGTGRARVDSDDDTAIEVRNLGAVTVRDLRVTGSGRDANRGAGILISCDRPADARLDPVTIEGVEASGFGLEGICVRSEPADDSSSGFDGVTIRDCRAFDNGRYGIHVIGLLKEPAPPGLRRHHKRVEILHCLAHDNTGDPEFLDNHSGSGIMVGSADGGRIEGCVAYRNGELCHSRLGGPCGIWAYACRGFTIRACQSYRNRTGRGLDGAGFDLDGGMEDSVIEYCTSLGNDGAGYLLYDYGGSPFRWRNNTLRHCLSVDDGGKNRYGGISIGTHGGAIDGLDVYQNTVIAHPSEWGGRPAAVLFFNPKDLRRVRLLNNALVGHEVPVVADLGDARGVRFVGNGYWAGGPPPRFDEIPGLVAWRAATGQERWDGRPSGLEADPLFEVSPQGEPSPTAASPRISTSRRLGDRSPFRGAGVDLGAFGIDPGGPTPRKAGRPDIGSEE